MTFGQALQTLLSLSVGLDAEADARAAVGRLLERVAASDDPEALRAALTELGARLLLGRAV